MRLDKYLSERFFSSRAKAARAIAAGEVTVNGHLAKSSDEVSEADAIVIAPSEDPYVSAGGKKLARALEVFPESVEGAVCADFGASTGGFTDCLLRHGAKRVYAIDVGESQLDPALVTDPRVVIMDRTNVRYLRREDLPETPDIVTIDVSFISLAHVLPAAAAVLQESGKVLALIKPQFECGLGGTDKHGVVKDPKVRKASVLHVVRFAHELGLQVYALVNAPLLPRKNVEYMVGLCKGGAVSLSEEEILRCVGSLIV